MLDRLRWLLRRRDSVVREWEWYARRHRGSGTDRPLGDEWNTPEIIGLDVAPGAIVDHIDRMVLEPQLGRVHTLLELGAGGGRFTEPLLLRSQRLIASDTSPTMIRLLRDRFANRPNITFLLLEGRDLRDIADESVDGVFSYDVFIHLSAWNIYAYLEELRRVLRTDGRAILHHANTRSPLGWKRFLRDVARFRSGEPARAQFTPMTPELMAELAERAGLKVLASLTEVVPRDCISVLARPG